MHKRDKSAVHKRDNSAVHKRPTNRKAYPHTMAHARNPAELQGKAIQYAMTIEYHKRYLCGPRLLQSLTGVAKVITRAQTLRNLQWLSHPKGQFNTNTVGKALREQWADADLAKRDKAKINFALWAAEEAEDENAEAFLGEHDTSSEGLEGEQLEAYWAEQSRIEEAKTAIQTAKTTLREARWNQKQLKLGRNYYPPRPFPRDGGKGGGKGKSNVQCFKCGGPHFQSQCPQKLKGR